MKFFETKALDITTQIVLAKVTNSEGIVNAGSGKATAEFFKSVYEGAREITSSIND